MRSLRLAVAMLLSTVSFAASPAHATCGAEGCPLVRDGLGGVGTRFAFDMRFQDVTQDQLWSGSNKATLDDIFAESESHGEVELYTRTRSWVAEGRARVTDRLNVFATLPYMQREHRHFLAHTPSYNPAFLDQWKYEGLGDATVLGQFRALELRGGPRVTLQGGVKLPTGRTHVPHEAKENFGFESTLESSARPGSGSTDWVTGALVSQPLPWHRALPITGSVLARFNTKGTDDFKVGDELQAGLAGGYAPLPWLTLLGQVNYSSHGSDESADDTEAAHSGMRSLFLTPGVNVRVGSLLSVYGLLQTRAWGRSDEPTIVATNHFVFGTTYSLGH